MKIHRQLLACLFLPATVASAGETLDLCVARLERMGLGSLEGKAFGVVSYNGTIFAPPSFPVWLEPGEGERAALAWGMVPARVYDAPSGPLKQWNKGALGISIPGEEANLAEVLAWKECEMPPEIQAVLLARVGQGERAREIERTLLPPGPELDARLDEAESAVLNLRRYVAWREFNHSLRLDTYARALDEALSHHDNEKVKGLADMRRMRAMLAEREKPAPVLKGEGITPAHQAWLDRVLRADGETLHREVGYGLPEVLFVARSGRHGEKSERLMDLGPFGLDAGWMLAALCEHSYPLPVENEVLFQMGQPWVSHATLWNESSGYLYPAPLSLSDLALIMATALFKWLPGHLDETRPLADQLREVARKGPGKSEAALALELVERSREEKKPLNHRVCEWMAERPVFDTNEVFAAYMGDPRWLPWSEPAWVAWIKRRGRELSPELDRLEAAFPPEWVQATRGTPLQAAGRPPDSEPTDLDKLQIVRRCRARLDPLYSLRESLRKGAPSPEWLKELWEQVGAEPACAAAAETLSAQTNALYRSRALHAIWQLHPSNPPRPAPDALLANASFWKTVFADETPVHVRTDWLPEDQPHPAGWVAIETFLHLQTLRLEPETAETWRSDAEFLLRMEADVVWHRLREAADTSLREGGVLRPLPSSRDVTKARAAELAEKLRAGSKDLDWIHSLSTSERLWLWRELEMPSLSEKPLSSTPPALWRLANRWVEIRDRTGQLPEALRREWENQGLVPRTLQSLLLFITLQPGDRMVARITRQTALRGAILEIDRMSPAEQEEFAQWESYARAALRDREGEVFHCVLHEKDVWAWTPRDAMPGEEHWLEPQANAPGLAFNADLARRLGAFGLGGTGEEGPHRSLRLTVGVIPPSAIETTR